MDASHADAPLPEAPRGRYLLTLSLGALGVVYGDIGTSPIYALRECFAGPYGIAIGRANVLGVLSLIFWSLVLVISVKYLAYVMRADNRGEGGIIALMALASPGGRHQGLVVLGLFGAALLYGDGMITPAISVLSAVEGLGVATPLFEPYVVWITIAILVALFAFQSGGTGRVGVVFGPITLVWFITIAVLGAVQVVRMPGVLEAVSPLHALDFFRRNQAQGFLVLGAVFLVVTGGEALYADMGHFGRRPIRLAWFALVLPALLLSYFGQGALLLTRPDEAEHLFFAQAPTWALYPLVGISTAATIIASQAVISGAFSLTRQAIQLGYLPRLQIEHTSERQIGQIYIPLVNWVVMLACIGLVVGFGSSSNLAAAYGVAVTSDMVLTTILFAVVALARWRWALGAVVLLVSTFLLVDLAFWGANIVKVPQGGWFPLVIAAAVLAMMTTWKRGRELLRERMEPSELPLELFVKQMTGKPPLRVPGTAVFLHRNADATPPALLHNLKHNKVLHERVVFLTIVTQEVPKVPRSERIEITELAEGFFKVVARYGFTQSPNVPAILDACRARGLPFKTLETTFFLGSETLIPTRRRGMAIWRERLFAFMSRNAQKATTFFRIPANRVVELGAQVEL